jgi:hypothetical protein
MIQGAVGSLDLEHAADNDRSEQNAQNAEQDI